MNKNGENRFRKKLNKNTTCTGNGGNRFRGKNLTRTPHAWEMGKTGSGEKMLNGKMIRENLMGKPLWRHKDYPDGGMGMIKMMEGMIQMAAQGWSRCCMDGLI
jgi:hypothetical protein